MKRNLIVLLSLAGAMLAASANGQGQDLYYGSYNGIWEGALQFASFDLKTSETKKSTAEARRRIVINGTKARVFTFDKAKDNWSEVKPNAFSVSVHKTNAVVYASDSASDVMDKTGSGGWVETWSFVLTKKDRDAVYTHFTRAVSNYLSPAEKDGSRFFSTGFGELRRVN